MAQHARVILGTLDTTFDDITPLYLDFAAGAEALVAGDADVAQAAVVNVLVSHARVADDTVREVTSAIFAARNELPRLNALFDGMAELFNPLRTEGAAALEFGDVPVHPGAAAAYRAAGLLT